MLEIDGSQGEGGGQILRTSLALSILTRQPMRITRIRSGRTKPGLQSQHLKSVQAAAAISNAQVEGASFGSQVLVFKPGEVKHGRYQFDIGTAGSTSLVFQTIFLPLSRSDRLSQLLLIGGTHVPFAPCYHYLEQQWLSYLKKAGCEAQLFLEAAGFYPRGGGRMRAIIQPATQITPLHVTERGALLRIQGISGVANLDMSIGKRQKLHALRRLEERLRAVKIEDLELTSPVKGTFLLLRAEFEHSTCCYSALGELGKRAEIVADEAVDKLEAFLATDGAIDQYLADQLMLPLAFAGGESLLRTSKVTQHQLTNAAVIQQFMAVEIHIDGDLGKPGLIRITP